MFLVAGGTRAAEAPVNLGTAASFAVLAGAGVTNTGPSDLNGDLGSCPTPALTGFTPDMVSGAIHANDAVACGAQSDLVIAYNDAAGRAPNTTFPGPTDLTGMTLAPGVYKSPSSLSLTGTVTLDGQGDPNSVFIFQAASTLITAPDSRVELINGAQACNVFWQVGSSATLGVRSTFVGTILALTAIAANTNAVINGRLLARNASVTLDSNTITVPSCAPAPTTTLAPTTSTAGPTTTSTVGPTTTSTVVGPTTTSTVVGPTTTSTVVGPTTTSTVVGPTTTSTVVGPTTTSTIGPTTTTTVGATTTTAAPIAPTTTALDVTTTSVAGATTTTGLGATTTTATAAGTGTGSGTTSTTGTSTTIGTTTTSSPTTSSPTTTVVVGGTTPTTVPDVGVTATQSSGITAGATTTSVAPAGTDQVGGAGSLARTGSPSWTLALFAVIAIGLGGHLVTATSRRRLQPSRCYLPGEPV